MAVLQDTSKPPRINHLDQTSALRAAFRNTTAWHAVYPTYHTTNRRRLPKYRLECGKDSYEQYLMGSQPPLRGWDARVACDRQKHTNDSLLETLHQRLVDFTQRVTRPAPECHLLMICRFGTKWKRSPPRSRHNYSLWTWFNLLPAAMIRWLKALAS